MIDGYASANAIPPLPAARPELELMGGGIFLVLVLGLLSELAPGLVDRELDFSRAGLVVGTSWLLSPLPGTCPAPNKSSAEES